MTSTGSGAPGLSGLGGSSSGNGLDGGIGDSASRRSSAYASMLQGEQQRLALQLEVQRQAQAQAQAEARMKALLDHEAHVQDQMRLLRQRQQLTSPGNHQSSALSASAYDMLSSSTTNGGGAGDLDPSLSSAARLFSNNGSSATAQNNHRASLLGLQGACCGGGNGAAMTNPHQTNSVLQPSLMREEALVFGKISRQNSDQAAVADVALLHQSRLSTSDQDKTGKDLGDVKEQHESDGAGDEEEELDDEEYFKAQAGEPAADGGYPIAREAFPIKLYRILYEAEQNKQDDIISFFPHGRAFAVHKSKEFTRDIMPKYFPAGRMNTFLKQLNLYGFRRITEGRDKGGYFHKDFLKGKRYLCKKIKRKKVHVNKAPPPTAAAHHVHSHFQQSSLQPQLPFLDPLVGGLGNTTSLAGAGHQSLFQQHQQMALGLQPSASSNASSLFPSSAAGNNSLLNASSSELTQAYIQDLPGLQSPATATRLHSANFNNAMNFNNHTMNSNNMNMNTMNMNNLNNNNLR